MKIFSNHEACPEFEIRVTDIPGKTIARVTRKSKTIEIRESKFDELSENELYIILRWCFYKHSINSRTAISYRLADLKTINNCLSIGLTKDIINSTFVKFLTESKTPMNFQRIKTVNNLTK